MSSLKPIGTTIIGKLLSFVYGAVVKYRNRQFDKYPPKPLPFPVISVGGISAGGTGKTPLTASIIEHLISIGKTPILFSRGYGRISKKTVIVSAEELDLSWEIVGDEPAMLRKRYPQLWLAIDGNRTRAAEILIQNLPHNAVGIMDDGFQHRKMHRDLNIVTLPGTVGHDALIPAGLLREPLSSLERADIIVFTNEPDTFTLSVLDKLGHSSNFGVSSTIASHLTNTATNDTTNSIRSEVTLLSGIARPERFFESINPLVTGIKNHQIFADHHIYSAQDLRIIENAPAHLFCTTEKDAIRIVTKISAKTNNLWYLSIKQRFNDSQFHDRFYDLINRCLEIK